MKIIPFYELMRRPVFLSKSIWYEILSGPFPLEDESVLYLAKPTGQIFPSKEFSERRYYIRIARVGKELIKLDETRMGDKLRFRMLELLRIADQIHDIDDGASIRYFFPNRPAYRFHEYQIYVAKIHNKKEWMDELTIPQMPDINAEKIGLTDMKLSVHGFKYLKHAKIENLKKLVSLLPTELDEICHGNKNVIREFEEVAARFGVYFVQLP